MSEQQDTPQDFQEILKREGLTPGRAAEKTLPVGLVDAYDQQFQEPSTHRRPPSGRPDLAAGLRTRHARQRAPEYSCESFTQDGRVIVESRTITPEQVWVIFDQICAENDLPSAAETMMSPGRGRPDAEEETRQETRAAVAAAVYARGVPQHTIASALGIGTANTSRLVARGKGCNIAVPSECEDFAVRFRARGK